MSFRVYIYFSTQYFYPICLLIFRASVDALCRDGAQVKYDVIGTQKAFKLGEDI